MNIQIVVGYVHRRMQSVKWKKEKITRWDSKLDFSLKTVITILYKSTFGDKCLGEIKIEMEHLLEL